MGEPRATRPPASRAGFSLIELMLATALAGLVIAGATSILGLVARAEQTLSTRHRQVTQMAGLHGALQDAFGSIVVSETSRPSGNDDEDPREEISLQGVRDRESIEQILSRVVDATGEPVRPRMILARDGRAFAGRGPGAAGSSPSGQFFELVVSRPPGGYSLPERLQGEDRAAVQNSRLSPRGVLELRADPDRPETSILWWRPLQHDGTGFYETVAGDRDRQALKLLEGVEAMRWRVFADRERRETFVATWHPDLPAYIELELRTSTGLYANWMFEIDWSIDAEWVSPAPSDDDEQSDDQDEQSAEDDATNNAGNDAANRDSNRSNAGGRGPSRSPRGSDAPRGEGGR